LRFPLEAELRYQIVRRGPGQLIRGTGQTENISSRGLAFRADRPLQSGMRLRVSMAWPAKLDECKLRLVFEGVVLRVGGNLVIVTIKGAEFRTAGRSTPAAREEIATVAGAIEAAPWPSGSLLVQ
jgi:PilZ domain